MILSRAESWRQGLARAFALAFDGFHRGHLRQGDVAAGGDAAEGVFDAVDLGLPDRLAEPDGEAVNLQAAPARGQEVAELMHEDEQVEKRQHFQRNQDRFQNGHILNRRAPIPGHA